MKVINSLSIHWNLLDRLDPVKECIIGSNRLHVRRSSSHPLNQKGTCSVHKTVHKINVKPTKFVSDMTLGI